MLRFFPGPRLPGSGSHDRSVRIGVSIGSQSPYGVRLVIPCGESETRLLRIGRVWGPLTCKGDSKCKANFIFHTNARSLSDK